MNPPQTPSRPPQYTLSMIKGLLGLLALLTLGISLFIIDALTPQNLLHPTARPPTYNYPEKSVSDSEWICIPPLPPYITRIPLSSLPPSFLTNLNSAKIRLRNRLDAYIATSNDTIAISVIHSHSSSPSSSSSPSQGAAAGEELFWWGKGRIRLNTTAQEDDTPVTRSSIFRIASLTKVFTVLQGLLLQDRSLSLWNSSSGWSPRLTMSDPIHLHLPDFTLPPPFTNEHITLNMLGGHTSGLAHDISVGGVNFSDESGSGVLEYMPWSSPNRYYCPQTQNNQKVLNFGLRAMEKGYMGKGGNGRGDGVARISAPGKCRLMREGGEDKGWHMCTKEELFRLVKESRLIWLPGEMASYSNTGFDVLGWALQNFASSFDGRTGGTEESYLLRDLLNRDVFQPLGMNSSFFHPIPEHLKHEMTVPRSDHMVDLDFGEAYDPAGGMYSTTSNLNSFLLSILSPEPTILNPATLRNWLRPSLSLPNGLSSVGIPWEIESWKYPSSPLTPGPVYQLYGKGGALPGHYSHISLIPELGYGMVALVAIGSEQGDVEKGAVKESNPNLLSNIVHDELVAPLREAYTSYLKEIYAGTYIQYSPAPSAATMAKPTQGKATISLDRNGFLVLDSLVTSSNISLLAYLDSLNPSASNTYASGGKLWPSGIEGEFRVRGGRAPETTYGKRSCREWFGFDEITTEDGWGVDKIVIRKYRDDPQKRLDGSRSDVGSGTLELVYEPLDVVFRKGDL